VQPGPVVDARRPRDGACRHVDEVVEAGEWLDHARSGPGGGGGRAGAVFIMIIMKIILAIIAGVCLT
jgi:hypothetical protein